MAEITGPRYDVNLAEVGKPEQLPDIGAAMTQAFQRATNLVETSWLNQYQYQMAQYSLQDAAAKLRGLDTENDINRQTFQQRADTFPLEQQQRKQNLAITQNNLDQSNWQVGQRDQALKQLQSWQSEFNAINSDDPDAAEKLRQLDAKYPLVAVSPFTSAQHDKAVNGLSVVQQNSTKLALNNDYISKLSAAQKSGLEGGVTLLDPSVDVRSEVNKGNGPQIWRQVNTNAAIDRLRRIEDVASPQDKAALQQMENELISPRNAVADFGADGTLSSRISNKILGYEQAYGIVNPYAGLTKEVVTKQYDKQGKEIGSTTIKVPITLADITAANTPPVPPTPKEYKFDPKLTPEGKQAAAEIAKENPNASPDSAGFAARVRDRYLQLRTKEGKPADATQEEIDDQYQQVRALQQQQKQQTQNQNVKPVQGTSVVPILQPPQQNAPQAPRTIRRATTGRTGKFSYTFPEELAPEGSWQRAWNESVGRLATTQGFTNEDLENMPRFASTESGEQEYYQAYGQGRTATLSGGGYTPPKEAGAVAGIDPNVWGMVMREEGPEFGPDGNHPSVFGLWGDKAGIEGNAYQIVKQYGAHSPEAYQAVTSAWVNGFLRTSQPWLLRSPGMQGLVISDSQHTGGETAARIIQEMGGTDAVNQMDPRQAVAEYTRLRGRLWGGNQSRVRREEAWALANS